MCWRATLAMEMSSTSMKAASPTVGATSPSRVAAGFGAPANGPEASSASPSRLDILAHLHARHRRHAGPERPARVGRIVEHDLDRNALHHLDEVARGVLRRQQAEGRPTAALEAVDMAMEGLAGIGIDADLDRLSGAHEIELRRLEVGGDPDFQRHERDEVLADLHIVAGRDVLVRDRAGLRG